eukprot:CAMPEP_0197062842 /NCGR_PEP_ID=MMETSP1384-20130603/148392_1 /TAXON_ID=29189 /ORGANISM="Ammonia sp." /LENGTH=346 /DNA_ID=CAMNT_0042498933 /DNA_START=3 /DNA_END=1046 /DNA_ORIENTATION=-
MKACRITPRLQLCGVVDDSVVNAKQFGDQYQIPFAQNLASFIESEGLPDAIWLSTPTPTHPDLIEYAASQCIPVATEKPVAMDPVTTEKCYQLCEAVNIPLFCSFNRRVDPHYDSLAKHVRSGKIGSVQSMHSMFRDHPIPPIEFLVQGGDLYHDCAVHQIDYARSLMKTDENEHVEVRRVYATGYSFHDTLRKHNVLDVTNGLLTFDNNVTYSIHCSRTATYGYDERFEVFGESGCVKLNNMNESACDVETNQGVNKSCFQFSFPQRYEHAFRIEMEKFAKVLQGEEEPFVSCMDACRATQIAEACRLSVEHQIPVEIEYDPEVISKCKYSVNADSKQLHHNVCI